MALAQGADPQRIVLTRVFPQPNQIGLFIANADGSSERPLVTPADISCEPMGATFNSSRTTQWEERTPAWQPAQKRPMR
jgi:hypothetical protein